MKKMFLGLAAFGLLLASCSDPSKTELLTDGAWDVSSYKVNGTEMINTSPQWTNAKMNFNTDNSFLMHNNIDSISGTWALLNEETVLRVITNDTLDFDIVALEEKFAHIHGIDTSDTLQIQLTRP